MKKTLNMICPHCKLKAELKIQEEAEMILMRCVSCSAPYLYFHGETFEVNESEMDHLKSAEMREVEGLLKVDEEQEASALEVEDEGKESVMPTIKKEDIKPRTERDRVITKQDIIDLRIDLEVSKDVLEFVEKI